MGLWETQSDIETGIQCLSKTKTINVVKAQIRFRIDILGSQAPRKISYTKSTVPELIDILVELTKLDIQEEKLTMCNIIKDPKCIVGFQFSQKWSTEFADNVCKGEIKECIQQPGQDTEFVCQFQGEDEVTIQTVAELLADAAVGDLFLYV